MVFKKKIKEDIEFYALCYALTDPEDARRRLLFFNKVKELKRILK